jgi:hypothetical protein
MLAPSFQAGTSRIRLLWAWGPRPGTFNAAAQIIDGGRLELLVGGRGVCVFRAS